jgi:hypothetical protein
MPFDGVPNRARVLADALDLLHCRGWCKGMLKDEDGRLCSIGAILAVQGMFLNSYRPRIGLGLAAEGCQAIGLSPWTISSFNDAPERTFAEVEAWFEKRIAAALAGETG